MVEQALPAEYWQQRYDQGTTGWDRGAASPGLEPFLERARSAGWRRILVPGCGRGHEVAALSRQGLEVTAVDFATAAIQETSALLQTEGLVAELVQADLLQFNMAVPVEAIYEQTCLCALHPSQWSAYEKKLHEWLVPGGTLFALFMQTTSPQGPPFACPLIEMRQLFPADRWLWHGVVARVDHPLGLHEWACQLEKKAENSTSNDQHGTTEVPAHEQ